MYLSSLQNVHKFILGQEVKEGLCTLFPKYYVEWLKSDDSHKYLRIYRVTNGLFGTSLGSNTQPIGSIDLDINTENRVVQIPFWLCNDSSLVKLCGGPMYGHPLDVETADSVKSILFDYAEKIGTKYNCNWLHRDVHHNLREYTNDVSRFGFKLNGQKALDHGAWVQTWKKINC